MTLCGLSGALFVVLSSLPGDPVELLITSNPALSADDIARERRLRGLDQPLPTQWWRWLVGTPAAHLPPPTKTLPAQVVEAVARTAPDDDDDGDGDAFATLVTIPLDDIPAGLSLTALAPAFLVPGGFRASLMPGATRLIVVVKDERGQESPWSVDVFVAPPRDDLTEPRPPESLERDARAVSPLQAPIPRIVDDEAPAGQHVVIGADSVVRVVNGPPLLDQERFVCGAICALAFNLDGLGWSWAQKRPVAELLVGEQAQCGNARREPGEACDDGNDEGGDGCDHACFVEGMTFFARLDTRLAGWLVSMGRIGNTLLLTVPALALALGASLLLGTLAGWRGGRLDRLVTSSAAFVSAIPAFCLALLLIAVCAERLQIVPSGGLFSPGIHEQGVAAVVVDRARHAFLPVTVLSLVWSGRLIQQVRGAVAAAVAGDFVRTARMKGASEWRVVVHHVVPHAAVPLVTVVGLSLPSLFGGALITETVFAWPGIGRLLYDAIMQNDLYVAMVIAWITAALVLAGSLCADVAVALLDPRAKARTL